MTVEQLKKHFGNLNRVAVTLKINRVNVYNWQRRNAIPARRQLEIQKLTKGKLKAGL